MSDDVTDATAPCAFCDESASQALLRILMLRGIFEAGKADPVQRLMKPEKRDEVNWNRVLLLGRSF